MAADAAGALVGVDPAKAFAENAIKVIEIASMLKIFFMV
jgi:hypothetical protein